MSDELKLLRADLKRIESFRLRYKADVFLGDVRDDLRKRIAALEAEADPWREAKRAHEWLRDALSHRTVFAGADLVSKHLDHLTAENASLEKRVAELEAEPEFTPAVLKRAEEIEIGDVILASGLIRTVTEIDGDHPNRRIIRCDGWMAWFGNHDLIAVLRKPLVDAKTVADMQPPFEGPIVGFEPVLDPARVLLTAIGILAGEREFRASAAISDAMFRSGISADKPYRLKGTDE